MLRSSVAVNVSTRSAIGADIINNYVSTYRYLPEYHTFDYYALAPWPYDPLLYQQDWIRAVQTIESWLNQYTGPHLVEWAYSTQREQEYWQACIAFRREKYKTLFLLAWA